MLPDLGTYAIPVLSAYASMIVLLAGIILISMKRGNDSKKTLAKLEENRKAKSDE